MEKREYDERPWGNYEVLDSQTTFKVKRITVKPAGCLSLQSHNFREETWVVVEGSGEFQLDDSITSVKAGSILTIGLKQKHRMRNTGTEPLVFVEIQTGTYFGEDDIIRYDDIYNRHLSN